MSDHISILHISDVHFGCRDDVGVQDHVLEALEEAIEQATSPIHCVVFTGDLAQKASSSEFLQGQDWLTRVCAIAKAPCILVPGNHDIARNAADVKMLRSAFHDQDMYGRWKEDIFRKHEHAKPFLDWFQMAKKDNPAFVNGWGTNPTLDKVELSLGGIDCLFVCVNTALLSCDDEDEGKLCIDLQGFNGSLRKRVSETKLVIAIGHHPISWLAPWNKLEIEKTLGQLTGPHLYLHGHLHELAHTSNYQSTGAGYFNGAAGAAYPGAPYKKQFALIRLDLIKAQVISQVYEYHEDAGKWGTNSALSYPVPTRLPESSKCQSSRAVEQEPTSSRTERWSNPFSEVMANGMPPEAIHRLFVEQTDSLTSVKNHRGTIVEGQRGTGKTMLLRYFSLEVQSSMLLQGTPGVDVIDRFNQSDTPFGVYCCLTNAGLNRSDFAAVSDAARRNSLFGHLAVLFVISKLLSAMNALMNSTAHHGWLDDVFKNYLVRLLKLPAALQHSPTTSFLQTAIDEIDLSLVVVNEHIASLLPGGAPTDFNPWLSPVTTFITVFERVKRALGMKAPFFLLIDDFDQLSSDQQSILFSAAAARRHDIVCYKFGVMSGGQKTFLAGDGRTFREGDDYNFVALDWGDGGLNTDDSNSSYVKTVDEICERRMRRAKWPTSVNLSTLLDNWEIGKRLRDEAKALASIEYDQLRPEARPNTFDNFWTKQGNAKYFRLLAKRKTQHRYAGKSTVIDLSSGIFRQFLELCSGIVDLALTDAKWNPATGEKIGSEKQNKAIREWSKDMYRSLGSSGDVSTLRRSDQIITSQHLINLANSLSKFFQARLMSDSKDPEVIAIAIREDLPSTSFAQCLLDVAVRESVLQSRSVDYPSKSGGGDRFPTYLLNRRLVPHVGIGSKLQGRHEIDGALLTLAATDPDQFLKKMAKRTSSDQQSLLI